MDENMISPLQNGPIRERRITDLIFCLLMFVFWAGTIFVLVWAFANGNPWRLAVTFDKDNVQCGDSDSNTSDYKFAYFYQPLLNLTNVVCIDKCPQWSKDNSAPSQINCFGKNTEKNAKINNCQSNKIFSFSDLPIR